VTPVASAPAPAPPFNGQFFPAPQMSMEKPKQLPDTPVDRAAFNKRKAEMAEEALKQVEYKLRYPFWSGPLAENLMYHPPSFGHGVMKGPGGADPTVEVWPEKLFFRLGEPIRIFATFRDGDAPIQPDSIDAKTVRALRPRPELPLQFTDRGDGVMVATLTLSDDVARANRGEWGVSLDSYVKGEHRQPHTHFFVQVTDATITGPYRFALEQGSVALYVGVNVTAPSSQGLRGELWGPHGEPIAYSGAHGDHLPVGSSTMKLTFYGKVIRDSGVDGPYHIKNLVLMTTDENSDRFENDPVDPDLSTPPWTHDVFTDRSINGDNPVLLEKKQILTEERDQAKAGLYDPNDPIPPRPSTVDKRTAPKIQ